MQWRQPTSYQAIQVMHKKQKENERKDHIETVFKEAHLGFCPACAASWRLLEARQASQERDEVTGHWFSIQMLSPASSCPDKGPPSLTALQQQHPRDDIHSLLSTLVWRCPASRHVDQTVATGSCAAPQSSTVSYSKGMISGECTSCHDMIWLEKAQMLSKT